MPPAIKNSTTVKCCIDDTPFCGVNKGVCGIGYCPKGANCLNSMQEYCSKLENSFDGKEIDPDCLTYIKKTTPPNAIQVSESILKSFYPDPNNTKLSGNIYNKSAIDLCKNAPPGTCDNFLKNICKRFTNRDQLECFGDKNCEEVKKLCGCNLNSSLYYKDRTSPLVPEQCDPICNFPGSVKRAVNGEFLPCNQNICLIDIDTKSNWINSQANLNQKCSGTPKDGKYNCFIDAQLIAGGITIKDLNLSQDCSSCSIVDSNNTNTPPKKVSCETGKGQPTSFPYVYIGMGLISIVFIILLLIFILNL